MKKNHILQKRAKSIYLNPPLYFPTDILQFFNKNPSKKVLSNKTIAGTKLTGNKYENADLSKNEEGFCIKLRRL